MKTILSGMQPSGKLHIGNYLGALKNWVELQNSGMYNCFFTIVDLHAMSERFNPKTLPGFTKDLLLDYLSTGIDPKRSTIFVQSHILEHTYLSWIFSTLTPIAELQRMHQFKDKSGDGNVINTGLFTYPILMAADILLYKADTVPVGDDQNQHVEITRVIARKFNNAFGRTFPEPNVLLTKTPRIMSLTDPLNKMSKSKGEKNYIALSDSPDVIWKKIAGAVTDPGHTRSYTSSGVDIGPGVTNLFSILQAFDEEQKTYQHFKKLYGAGELKYKQLKETVTETIVQALRPIQEKRRALEKEPAYLSDILIEGRKKAQEVAESTLAEVRKKTGLL